MVWCCGSARMAKLKLLRHRDTTWEHDCDECIHVYLACAVDKSTVAVKKQLFAKTRTQRGCSISWQQPTHRPSHMAVLAGVLRDERPCLSNTVNMAQSITGEPTSFIRPAQSYNLCIHHEAPTTRIYLSLNFEIIVLICTQSTNIRSQNCAWVPKMRVSIHFLSSPSLPLVAQVFLFPPIGVCVWGGEMGMLETKPEASTQVLTNTGRKPNVSSNINSKIHLHKWFSSLYVFKRKCNF